VAVVKTDFADARTAVYGILADDGT